MPTVVQDLISECERAFGILESGIAKPSLVPFGNLGLVYRCVEERLDQAILQKTARVITSMRGLLSLLRDGLYQESAVLFRVIDELSEDTIFLCQPLLTGETTELHKEYLRYFYMEEFSDPNNPLASAQTRPTVPRRKIHAAIANIEENPVNPSDGLDVFQTLSKTFSGYVHGASGHILEMYGGEPPQFHLAGMRGTPRQVEYERHSRHYFYRGLVTVMYVAVAFKDQDLLAHLYTIREQFERRTGMTNWPDPDKKVRSIRKHGA